METLLRQRIRGLRSFQLPCKEDVLQSAFKDKPLCPGSWPSNCAKVAPTSTPLRLDLRREGARVLRVAQRARAKLAGNLVDSYDPALRSTHRVLRALQVNGRWSGRRRACFTGVLRRRGRAAGAVLVQGRGTRSESCRRSTRCCKGGARRWGRSTGASACRLGAQDLSKAAEGKAESPGAGEAEDPGRAERQVRLCGCGLIIWDCWSQNGSKLHNFQPAELVTSDVTASSPLRFWSKKR